LRRKIPLARELRTEWSKTRIGSPKTRVSNYLSVAEDGYSAYDHAILTL
jgi:hypothetical protein